jgi:hypothetical protein
MTKRVEQRYCIKFCQKLGDSKAETIRKIQQAFGNDAMGATQIKEWFNPSAWFAVTVTSWHLNRLLRFVVTLMFGCGHNFKWP